MSAATILGGSLAGLVAQRDLLRSALVGCGVLAAASLAAVLLLAREKPRARNPTLTLRQAWLEVADRRRLPTLLAVGGFLFLWNFNPFSSNVLQHYSTEVLQFSEQFYGHQTSIQAAAQVVACIGYFLVCRRIPFAWLLHGSIAAGILATLCYWPMYNGPTAVLSSIAFGLCYQTGTLIQLDLAARVCPTQSAGTLFATLMAISNTGITAASAVSGGWYDWLAAATGSRHVAFDLLVAIGAAFTAGCWLVVWLLPVGDAANENAPMSDTDSGGH
jgi:Na+/melibiose symporter-like transporter